eukprot:195117-Rhodomonas_salina.1
MGRHERCSDAPQVAGAPRRRSGSGPPSSVLPGVLHGAALRGCRLTQCNRDAGQYITFRITCVQVTCPELEAACRANGPRRPHFRGRAKAGSESSLSVPPGARLAAEARFFFEFWST